VKFDSDDDNASKASKSKRGNMSGVKPQDKSSAKKTPRSSSKKREKDVDMHDANRTHYPLLKRL
jgi:hypothetical protein